MNSNQKSFLKFMVDTAQELMLNQEGFEDQGWVDLEYFRSLAEGNSTEVVVTQEKSECDHTDEIAVHSKYKASGRDVYKACLNCDAYWIEHVLWAGHSDDPTEVD